MNPTPDAPDGTIQPAAAVAAWLLPGLGHVLLGHRQRGAVLACSVGGLWLMGLLIGGISVVDSRAHRAWFVGQAMLAPNVLIDFYHARLAAPYPSGPTPQDNPPYSPAIGRAWEIGTLFTSLAGLLNLLVILDALTRPPLPRIPTHKPTNPADPAPLHPGPEARRA
jgi:hypothetical protein